MSTNLARNNPVVLGALEKNIFEHISMMAQEQLEVEMREEIAQLTQLQQQLQANPMMQQNPQVQQQLMQMSMALESRKAKLIAEMMQEFMEEENKIMGQFGNDPIAKLKARELDLRAMDNEKKREQDQEKINLDKSKQLMGQEQFDEKLRTE
jgi:2,3-bisphosphoglycerate-independent phosphoglycerate mutase